MGAAPDSTSNHQTVSSQLTATAAIVSLRVHARAQELGDEVYPGRTTVYRILKPQYLYTDDGKDFRLRLLHICQVEMLMIDESHRLRSKALAELQDILDKLQIAIVLVGTDRLNVVLKHDE